MLHRLAPVLLGGLLSVSAVYATPGIFWTDEATDTIHHANLDGSAIVVLVAPPDSENPGALALSVSSSRVQETSSRRVPPRSPRRAGRPAPPTRSLATRRAPVAPAASTRSATAPALLPPSRAAGLKTEDEKQGFRQEPDP